MKRDSEALKIRTKDFALRVLRLYRSCRELEKLEFWYSASSLQHIDRRKLPSSVPRKISD